MLTLRGLRLHSQVASSGGALHMENCTFEGSRAAWGGALNVRGGRLTATDTTFVACRATRGGAVHVSGGSAVLSGCTIEGCESSQAQGGGAVWVEGSGGVVLRDQTKLHRNHARDNTGAYRLLDSIHIETGGTLQYALPAPLAHYIDSARDGAWTADYRGAPSLSLKAGVQYRDYPSACAAGLFGNTRSVEAQSSALCSGLCPAGSTCGKATIVPAPCEVGGFCPEGSPAARPCPSGRFGNTSKLTTADECHACTKGAACSVGATAPVPCTPGTFAANGSSPTCAVCPEGSFQPATGAVGCVACGEGYNCPPGSSARIPASCNEGTYLPADKVFRGQDDCVPCPIGTWCVGGRSLPKKCGVGSFADVGGLGECTDCAPGNYQDEKGSTSCKVCPCCRPNPSCRPTPNPVAGLS